MSRKKFHKSNSFSFNECWERIKSRTPIENYSQLAEIIELSKSNVTKRKDENLFPIEWAFVIARKYELTTEWILTGEESIRLEEINQDFKFYEELEQWARETGGSSNIGWLKNQIENFFPMFKEWKKRKENGGNDKPDKLSSKVA